jgi:hypothetical protein
MQPDDLSGIPGLDIDGYLFNVQDVLRTPGREDEPQTGCGHLLKGVNEQGNTVDDHERRLAGMLAEGGGCRQSKYLVLGSQRESP